MSVNKYSLNRHREEDFPCIVILVSYQRCSAAAPVVGDTYVNTTIEMHTTDKVRDTNNELDSMHNNNNNNVVIHPPSSFWLAISKIELPQKCPVEDNLCQEEKYAFFKVFVMAKEKKIERTCGDVIK
jgi:hypothetical protein